MLFRSSILRNHGLIHGNIRPESIIIEEGKELNAKLTDFKIVYIKNKILNHDEYIAPEISSGSSSTNLMSDIWSIGAVMNLILKHVKSYSKLCANFVKEFLKS